jgi:uncharacterized membrane protein
MNENIYVKKEDDLTSLAKQKISNIMEKLKKYKEENKKSTWFLIILMIIFLPIILSDIKRRILYFLLY